MRTGLLVCGVLLTAAPVLAQGLAVERLPRERLDVVPPSARVSGDPGRMTVLETSCPAPSAVSLRRRIVDLAGQEWAFFGFQVVDQTGPRTSARPSPGARGTRGGRRGFRWVDPDESARVAASIAGYWTVTPEGSWILDDQNEAWNGPDGVGARWRNPWSAAFVSWVMCEAGLGDRSRFARAVAHHVYIDQAIRARNGGEAGAAYVARDVGEAAIEPGDLLCSARRPGYDTLAERQRQMGEGARTHCDVVVKVDGDGGRILAIGGNVRGVVSLKMLPTNGSLVPSGMFAHLELREAPIGPDLLDDAATFRALGCVLDDDAGLRQALARVVPEAAARC
jgi:hypothetical protein